MSDNVMIEHHVEMLGHQLPIVLQSMAGLVCESFRDRERDNPLAASRDDLTAWTEGVNSRLDAIYEQMLEQNRLLGQLCRAF